MNRLRRAPKLPFGKRKTGVCIEKAHRRRSRIGRQELYGKPCTAGDFAAADRQRPGISRDGIVCGFVPEKIADIPAGRFDAYGTSGRALPVGWRTDNSCKIAEVDDAKRAMLRNRRIEKSGSPSCFRSSGGVDRARFDEDSCKIET